MDPYSSDNGRGNPNSCILLEDGEPSAAEGSLVEFDGLGNAFFAVCEAN